MLIPHLHKALFVVCNAMRTEKFVLSLIFASFFSLAGQAQTASTVQGMENKYQNCLDKGKDMLGCSKANYRQMDSMLNTVYKSLRSSLDSSQKAQLKNEQIQWLVKRDKYFRETKNKFKRSHPGVNPESKA